MALIRDLWRGDVPLVKTYWLFGVVAGIFFRIAFAYGVFISFATWKSANKYRGQQRYAILAKVAVIWGAAILIKEALEIFGVD